MITSVQICANLQKSWNNTMSNDGSIIENMDLSHIHLAVIIKIESHPFYHIICDWFSWGWSKKKSKWPTQKNSFFESAILIFKKKNFLLHPHENQSQIMCKNGWDSIFSIMMVKQPKMSAGMIKEHECTCIWLNFTNILFVRVFGRIG